METHQVEIPRYRPTVQPKTLPMVSILSFLIAIVPSGAANARSRFVVLEGARLIDGTGRPPRALGFLFLDTRPNGIRPTVGRLRPCR